jgi:hypothetical protein
MAFIFYFVLNGIQKMYNRIFHWNEEVKLVFAYYSR